MYDECLDIICFEVVIDIRICRSNTLQSIEKSFYLSRAERDLLHREDYDLQV
jgi:hypothetical protein